jgi:hypothetical protein
VDINALNTDATAIHIARLQISIGVDIKLKKRISGKFRGREVLQNKTRLKNISLQRQVTSARRINA